MNKTTQHKCANPSCGKMFSRETKGKSYNKDPDRKYCSHDHCMRVVIETKFNVGDEVFYNRDGVISKSKVVNQIANLEGETARVFASVENGSTRYKKKCIDIVEQTLLFATPEEVGAHMVQLFKEGKTVKVSQGHHGTDKYMEIVPATPDPTE